jgi:hypothetical protein
MAGLALGLLMAFYGGYVQLRDTLEAINRRSRGQK